MLSKVKLHEHKNVNHKELYEIECNEKMEKELNDKMEFERKKERGELEGHQKVELDENVIDEIVDGVIEVSRSAEVSEFWFSNRLQYERTL